MMRQYRAHRRMGGHNPLGVGVVAVGSIFYLQDRAYFDSRFGGTAICRTPWQVQAFLNGMLHAARRDCGTGLWEDKHVSGRSDLAVVRSLRDGRQRTVAVRLLLLHDDWGLTKGTSAYPTLPDMRLYRCRPRQPGPTPALDQAA